MTRKNPDVCPVCERQARGEQDPDGNWSFPKTVYVRDEAIEIHGSCLELLLGSILRASPRDTTQLVCRTCGRRLRAIGPNEQRGKEDGDVSVGWYEMGAQAPICHDCWSLQRAKLFAVAGLDPAFYRREDVPPKERVCGTCLHQRVLHGSKLNTVAVMAGYYEEDDIVKGGKHCCKSPWSMNGPPEARDDWGCDDGWVPRPVEKEKMP